MTTTHRPGSVPPVAGRRCRPPEARRAARRRLVVLFVVFAVVVLQTACSSGSPTDGASDAAGGAGAGTGVTSGTGGRPIVVASTRLVGALVRSVAGDQVDVRVVARPDADPTTMTLDAADATLDGAALVVVVDPETYERGLAEPIRALGTGPTEVLSLAPQLNPIPLGGSELDPGSAGVDGETDPHIWLDPDRWTQAGRLVADAVTALAGVDAAAVRANVAAFDESVGRTDETVQATFAVVPEDRRTLVSDLPALGYLADRYGFDLVLATEAGSLNAAAAGGGSPAVFTAPDRYDSLAPTLSSAAPPQRVVMLDLEATSADVDPTELTAATAAYVELLVGTADAIASAVTA